MPDDLFLIDAYAHLYQAFYAIRGLTGPDGEPVNALFGFARLVRKIRKEYEPEYFAVVFDAPGEVFRHEIYPEYKATRKPMPASMERQIPMVKELLERQRIPALIAEGYEADDVMGTAARQSAEQNVGSVLVSTDKDVEQLVDSQTRVLHIHKSKEILLDPESLKEKRGIEADQIVEEMALSGDSSDNIPGVYGIGPKTANKLIKQFGSVENLYDNLDEVSSDHIREKLEENREEVELSRRLVTIACDVPLELNLKECKTETAETDETIEFYRAHGFTSLIDDNPGHRNPSPSVSVQGSLFETEAADGTSPLTPNNINSVSTNYCCCTTVSELREVKQTLADRSPFAVDLETTSLDPHEAAIVGVALSWDEFQGVYVPTMAPSSQNAVDINTVLDELRPILEDPEVGKIGHNLKYDSLVFKSAGVELRGISCDTMIASYLLFPAERAHGLNTVAERVLNYSPVSIKELIGEGREEKTMDRVSVQRVTPYACEDADVSFRLAARLMPMIERQELTALFKEMEIPLIHVLSEMEWRGINIDQDYLRGISRELEEELQGLEKKIHAKAGREFNVNSPQQLSEVLFEDMELPPPKGKKRTTGYSTARDVLTDLADEHEIAEHLLRWRELSKLKSTYADALVELVSPHTGRLHTSFNQTGTATGRLSSSEPNLQNIPVRTALGRKIRRAFVPSEPDMSLLSADYSQVELRVLAHCSEDETLREAFRSGRDIHRFVAAQINDVSEEEVSDEMRQRAKAVNFGIVYGQSAYGLSKSIGISVEEAQNFIDNYFERYPSVRKFIGETIRFARKNGYVHTLAGRRRSRASGTAAACGVPPRGSP